MKKTPKILWEESLEWGNSKGDPKIPEGSQKFRFPPLGSEEAASGLGGVCWEEKKIKIEFLVGKKSWKRGF